MSWLMPGFLALGGIAALVGFVLFILLAVPKLFDENSDYALLNNGGVKLWAVILAGIGGLFLGKFAYSRLVLHPTPPEETRG